MIANYAHDARDMKRLQRVYWLISTSNLLTAARKS